MRRGDGQRDPQSALTGLDVPEARPDQPVVVQIRRPGLGIRELGRWARFHCRAIARRGHLDTCDDLFIFAQAAKLSEEVGELNAELLARQRMQRVDKVRAGDSGLRDELADVVICCAILAEALQVDLNDALVRKMELVDNRYRVREQSGN